MDAMRLALKQKRMGSDHKGMGLMHEHEDEEHPAHHEAKEEKGLDLHSLVASLSPEQKSELMEMLSSEEGEEGSEETSSVAIQKGAASSEEKARIHEKMSSEPSEDTDLAMLDGDRATMHRVDKGVAPTGLGQRAKMAAAQRLKAKGKV